MATAEEVEAEILSPMRSLYRVPHGIDDPTAALVEYAKVLCRFDYDALVRAWAHIVVVHKRRDWPTIWDLNDALKETRLVERSPTPAYRASDDVDHRTPASRDRVRRMFKVLDKHKLSDTKFADTAADPEYLAIVDEYERSLARPDSRVPRETEREVS